MQNKQNTNSNPKKIKRGQSKSLRTCLGRDFFEPSQQKPSETTTLSN